LEALIVTEKCGLNCLGVTDWATLTPLVIAVIAQIIAKHKTLFSRGKLRARMPDTTKFGYAEDRPLSA
jgi:hypothetical protein